MKSKYSIKDLEHLSGIKAHTIRAWESRYNLIEPFRTDSNIRYYGDEHLKQILNIAVLVKNGLRISKVASMSEEDIRNAVISSGRYESNYASHISILKSAMLEYDEHTFDSQVSKCIIEYGVEEAMINVLGGLINEVSLLWQTGSISVSNEHFVSNLLKMKIFSLIDQVFQQSSSSAQDGFILYLPSGEYHELSLLYLYYHLKQKGYRVVYLGQSIPHEYLLEVHRRTGISKLISVFTTKPHFEEVDFYFERLGEIFHSTPCEFFLTGLQLSQAENISETSNIQMFNNVDEIRQLF